MSLHKRMLSKSAIKYGYNYAASPVITAVTTPAAATTSSLSKNTSSHASRTDVAPVSSYQTAATAPLASVSTYTPSRENCRATRVNTAVPSIPTALLVDLMSPSIKS